MPSNVLPLHLKQTFPPIIWIFTEGEGDEGIKSRLPSKIFSTLPKDANFVAAKWFRSPLWWCFPLARPAMEDINEPFKPEVPPPWWPWLPLPPPTGCAPPSPLVISVEEDGNPEAPEADIVEVDPPPESIDNAEDDKVELPAKPPDPPGHGVGGPAITPPSAEIRSSEPAILWRRKQWELKIIISFFG